MKGMSLFSSVGISELYLKDIGIDIKMAVELSEERVNFYNLIYPDVEVVSGNIKDYTIKEKIFNFVTENNIELLIATPPCQGMSTAGKGDWRDSRNELIKDVIDIIKKSNFKYCLIENVPSFFKTHIIHEDNKTTIEQLIKNELSDLYHIDMKIVNAINYGVPQNRKRAITLLTKKEYQKKYIFIGDSKIKTLRDAIGDLPNIYPLTGIKGKKAFKDIDQPPRHNERHIRIMKKTPTGQSAFNNEDEYKPKKINGKLIRGFSSTYKRMEWDKPAPTITMMNGAISSQNNVHPGNYNINNDEYDNPRVLTIHELMRVMSIPDDWRIPNNFSEQFIRKVIGEGVPPLMMMEIINNIKNGKG